MPFKFKLNKKWMLLMSIITVVTNLNMYKINNQSFLFAYQILVAILVMSLMEIGVIYHVKKIRADQNKENAKSFREVFIVYSMETLIRTSIILIITTISSILIIPPFIIFYKTFPMLTLMESNKNDNILELYRKSSDIQTGKVKEFVLHIRWLIVLILILFYVIISNKILSKGLSMPVNTMASLLLTFYYTDIKIRYYVDNVMNIENEPVTKISLIDDESEFESASKIRNATEVKSIKNKNKKKNKKTNNKWI